MSIELLLVLWLLVQTPAPAATESDASRALAQAEQLRNRGAAASTRESVPLFETALRLSRAAGDQKTEAAALTGLGRAQDALGDKRKAIELFGQALPLHERAGDGVSASYTLNYEALSRDFLGERTDALRLLAGALERARAAADRRVEATTLNNLGLVNVNLGERRKALEYYEQALALHKEVGNLRGQATTLTNIGTVYDQLGEKADALRYLNDALPLRRQIGDPREEAATLNNIGVVHLSTDQLQAAADHFRPALEKWRVAGDAGGEAATLHNMAAVREAQNDVQAAIDLYTQALALHRASRYRPGEGNTLGNLGKLYAALGDSERALDAYTKALEVHRGVGNRTSEASALTNIGAEYVLIGQYGRGLDHFTQALALWRAANDRSGEARTLLNVGRAEAGLGHSDLARTAYAQALDLSRAVSSRKVEAIALTSLGRFEEALTIQRAIGDQPGEAATLYALSRDEAAAGRLAASHEHLTAALSLVETTRASVTTPDLRMSYLAAVKDYFDLDVDVLMRLHAAEPANGWLARAFTVNEQARARVMRDMLAESRLQLREGVDPALLARERELAEQLSARAERQTRLLSAAHTPAQAEAIAASLRALRAQYQDVEGQIRRSSPRYAALTRAEPPTVDAIQRDVLDKDTVLLEFALGEPRSYVFAVSADGVSSAVLPPRSAIDRAVAAFQRLARSPAGGPATSDAAATLSRMLLSPIRASIGARRLAIVAAGSLQYVPFGALPDPSTSLRAGPAGGALPLLARHEVVSIPSAATLAAIRAGDSLRPRATRPLLVFADPVFSADDPRVTPPGPSTSPNAAPARSPQLQRSMDGFAETDTPARLERLIGSRREAASLLALAPGGNATGALDFDANRTAAAGPAVSNYRIIHFATHALVNGERPDLSGIVLSLVDRAGRAQDGFLGMSELFNLRLGAELVVLSACQTAVGKDVGGEGLLGLSRAFMYAGAPRVVATAWKVDDTATAALMKAFYENMLGPKRLRPAAALRAAQLSIRSQPRWSAPYFWAPFVLQGDWR